MFHHIPRAFATDLSKRSKPGALPQTPPKAMPLETIYFQMIGVQGRCPSCASVLRTTRGAEPRSCFARVSPPGSWYQTCGDSTFGHHALIRCDAVGDQ